MAHLLSLEAVVVGETAMLTSIPAAAASVASTSSSPRLSMVAAGACREGYRKSIGPRQDRLRLGTSVVAAAAATSNFREQSNKALLVCQQQPQVRQHHNNNRVIPISSAAAVALPGVLEEQEVVDIERLEEELNSASPFEIMDQALALFGTDIAIAFSGAEDVALIEYAHLTGRPFRVFSLDTGRLNPETYCLFAEVEKRYNIRIEYMFPDAVEVEALVRAKGLFSFYEDGHQECCRIRKVRPLKRALKGLRAWITGQRKDQSPGTRANVPVVQVDPVFEGMDGGVGSLVKWNPLANVVGTAVWSFLRTMDVPVNALHSQGFVSIGCEPCTRPVMPGQHEREGRWWWEDAKAKECGLHNGNVNGAASNASSEQMVEVADLFMSRSVSNLSCGEMETLVGKNKRSKSSLVVLYAPWCQFSQAMNDSFNAVAEKLCGPDLMVGKFRADREQKEFAQQALKLRTFPTILFFPKNSTQVIKYPSENRDVDALIAFVQAFQ
ncbi:unnamed protein product [Sphagnum troendelagicum]|uniref:Thioredoxin domain-containing protein n=1 Tax=Sphagnum troendelagicum TaxID=128251 RepID=A0ABP0TWJ0_9BRYO